MLKECFLLATQGVMPTSDLWSGENIKAIAKVAQKEYGIEAPKEPYVSPSDLKTNLAFQAASDQIAAGKAPDVTATMRFLTKYPASLWVANEKLTPLKDHCKKSAETYLKERKKRVMSCQAVH